MARRLDEWGLDAERPLLMQWEEAALEDDLIYEWLMRVIYPNREIMSLLDDSLL